MATVDDVGVRTVSDSLAAILRKEPDWSKLPADTPPMVRLLLRLHEGF